MSNRSGNNNILLVYPEARAGSVGGMTKKTFIRIEKGSDAMCPLRYRRAGVESKRGYGKASRRGRVRKALPDLSLRSVGGPCWRP